VRFANPPLTTGTGIPRELLSVSHPFRIAATSSAAGPECPPTVPRALAVMAHPTLPPAPSLAHLPTVPQGPPSLVHLPVGGHPVPAARSDTASAVLRALPAFIEKHHAVLLQIPLRILLIIVVALIVRTIAHRAVNRLLRPVQTGTVPRLLRPLSSRRSTQNLLQSAGLLSDRRAQRAATIASLLHSCISFVIFVLASLLIIGELRFDLAPFIAGTSIVGVAVAFGAQNLVKDFLAGIFMIFEDQYGVGDVIDFEKATGTVEAIGLRTTRLRDIEGTVWYVRNGEVVRVGNKSQGFAQLVLDVPIAAGDDLSAATDALADVARQLRADPQWSEVFLEDPEVQGVESLTREETVIRVVARVRPAEQWRTARELRRRIRSRFDVAATRRQAGEPSAPGQPADQPPG
jgi:moderate conductance mechanosensitive channel